MGIELKQFSKAINTKISFIFLICLSLFIYRLYMPTKTIIFGTEFLHEIKMVGQESYISFLYGLFVFIIT